MVLISSEKTLMSRLDFKNRIQETHFAFKEIYYLREGGWERVFQLLEI